MGIMSKLFGRRRATVDVSAGRELSVLKVFLKQDIGMVSKRCDVCRKTFPCPKGVLNLVTPSIDGWVLDVGGYCPKHRNRCSEHARFIPVGEGDAHINIKFGLGCSSCGSRLGACR